MRTRLSGALNWGTSVRIAALNKVELTHRTICGIWIGGPTQTINLYCWSQPNQLTECVGNRNDAGQYEWSSEELPQQSPPIEQPGESANRKLAVVNTANGVYLLSMDAGLNICWRHKDVYGVWEDEAGEFQCPTGTDLTGAFNANLCAVIVQAANVEEHSPMAIIAVAAENAVVDANLTPADGSPVTIHCYPEAPDGREPLTPFGPDRAAGFAIAYVDKNYTSHVLRIDHDGRVITNQALCQIEPERISRLRTLPGNEQRVIPTLYMTPGAYPRSVNLFAISSLHVTKTVISFSQIVPLALVKDLAAKRAAFYQAHHHLGLALGDRDVLAKKLIATHKTVREDFDNVTHVGNVGARDYYELRFLLSRALWERAFLAARVAQNAAIAAYNAMLKADRLIELNTIKTEARVMEAGVAIFPPLADGTILPVE